MSFAIFAIGSNDGRRDVDGRLDGGVHELGDEHERDREQQHRELELRRAEADRGDEHGDRDGEVDPEVPLRADRVDDPLGGEVEALEQRCRALPGHRAACALLARAISSPWS